MREKVAGIIICKQEIKDFRHYNSYVYIYICIYIYINASRLNTIMWM